MQNYKFGSYTELKHDNILYAKQAVAEMGGEFNEQEDYHYVDLTSEELNTLSSIGGLIDYINYTYLDMLRDVNSDIEDEDTTALIADVATNTDGYYLEEAVGMPYEIYVLCKINNKMFLTKGIVYS